MGIFRKTHYIDDRYIIRAKWLWFEVKGNENVLKYIAEQTVGEFIELIDE